MNVISMDVTGSVAAAIATYTKGEVLHLECVPDPVVIGTYALRATIKQRKQNPFDLEFLVKGVALNRIDAGDLQEVVFTEWPPVANL